MAVDLLIVNPPTAEAVYGSLADVGLTAIEPPLWCRIIAGYVKDKVAVNHKVEILDAEALGLGIGAAVWRISTKIKPRMVVLVAYGHQPSASTQQMDAVCALARGIKNQNAEELNTDIKTIVVGGHVSALADETLADEPAIDFAIDGEGPHTIVELLRWQNGYIGLRDVRGLVWRNGSQIIHNEAAPLLSVDDLRGDVWDMLPMQNYRAHNWQCFGDLGKRQPYASVYTSLGCPFRCSFCMIQAPFNPEINGNRYRMRKPSDIVAEFRMLHETYGVNTFKIVDEMFVLNERHYTAICKELAALNESDEFNIWAYARVDTVKPKHLALLRKAGIRWLALGIESGSKHVRDGAKKALKNDDIVQVVRDIQAADINVIGNYIFGLPDDNYESMQATLDLALECNTEFANFYSAMAYPGSQLYAEARQMGTKLPDCWEGYSQHNYETTPLPTESLQSWEVLAFRDNAFKTYFENPKYLAMVREKFGHATMEHVLEMAARRIPRKLLEAHYAAPMGPPVAGMDRLVSDVCKTDLADGRDSAGSAAK